MDSATTLEVMRRQEENYYAVRGDYSAGGNPYQYHDDEEEEQNDVRIGKGSSYNSSPTTVTTTTTTTSRMTFVDYSQRQEMTKWSYKVIEFLSFGHETVEIAINILDRFLLSKSGIIEVLHILELELLKQI